MPKKILFKPFLELRNISLSFSGRLLLEKVCLFLSLGEWVLLLGENGSGKTTLLRLIAGKIEDWKGELIVEGKIYTSANWNSQRAYEHGIAIVEQLPELPEKIKAWEYLLWGMEYQGSPLYLNREKAIVQIRKKLPFLRYFNFDLYASILELSISDRFRLCIVSAFLRARSLILWDESTIFLSRKEKDFFPELMKVLARKGLTTFMVTHEDLSWIKKVRSLYILEEKKVQLVKEEKIESRLIHYYQFTPLVPVLASSPEIIRAQTNKGTLVLRKGEIVSLVADSEIPLRAWESFFWGKKSPLIGSLFLTGKEISNLNSIQRRRLMGWFIPFLGAREEKAYYSLIFPFLFDRSSFLSCFIFLNKKHCLSWVKSIVPTHLWERLELPWRVLSGGEKQGIILSRELARKPAFLIASFPTQGLDKKAIGIFWKKMHKFTKEENGSLLVLTTNQIEAQTFSHTVYNLEDLYLKRDGGNNV